jgi:PhnB protein
MASHVLAVTARPAESGATLNPFVVVDGAADLVSFVVDVLGGVEVVDARTPTPDGRLIHAEVAVGDAHLMLADQLDGWPRHPGLLQLWVDDVAATLDDAVAHGARIITPATAFYGETTLGRMVDPWGNLWWLYAPAPGQREPTPAWEGGDDTVFRTIDAEMRMRSSSATDR